MKTLFNSKIDRRSLLKYGGGAAALALAAPAFITSSRAATTLRLAVPDPADSSVGRASRGGVSQVAIAAPALRAGPCPLLPPIASIQRLAFAQAAPEAAAFRLGMGFEILHEIDRAVTPGMLFGMSARGFALNLETIETGLAQIIIDEAVSGAQKDALERILKGEETEEAATHWWVFHAMSDTQHETLVRPIEFEVDIDARTARVSIPGVRQSTGEPIRNPVDGGEHRIRIQIPDGIEFEVAEIGSVTASANAAIRKVTSLLRKLVGLGPDQEARKQDRPRIRANDATRNSERAYGAYPVSGGGKAFGQTPHFDAPGRNE